MFEPALPIFSSGGTVGTRDKVSISGIGDPELAGEWLVVGLSLLVEAAKLLTVIGF